jgi:hypothetical protein
MPMHPGASWVQKVLKWCWSSPPEKLSAIFWNLFNFFLSLELNLLIGWLYNLLHKLYNLTHTPETSFRISTAAAVRGSFRRRDSISHMIGSCRLRSLATPMAVNSPSLKDNVRSTWKIKPSSSMFEFDLRRCRVWHSAFPVGEDTDTHILHLAHSPAYVLFCCSSEFLVHWSLLPPGCIATYVPRA